MANSPKELGAQIKRITDAWTELAPNAIFGSMTLAQYIAAVKPSVDARLLIDKMDEDKTQVIVGRDKSDVLSEVKNAAAIKGMVGDINYGDDSALYEKCGYIRKSQRKTGLTRKKKSGGGGPVPK